jgi:hypothetical protein
VISFEKLVEEAREKADVAVYTPPSSADREAQLQQGLIYAILAFAMATRGG